MAGIGFVLERLLEERSVRGFLAVSVAGALIVAGPWLVTSIALSIVSVALGDSGADFFAFIVYSYAATLVLMGGYHYVFTRAIADLLYVKDYGRIRTVLFRARAVAVGGGVIIGAGLGSVSGIGWPAIVATASVSLAWIEMMAVSLLRRFALILAAYVTGGVVLIAGGYVVELTSGGVVVLFGVSHVVTLLALAMVTHRFLAQQEATPTVEYTRSRTLPSLWAIGTLLYAIMWYDKILFWFAFGEPTTIGLPLFGEYDKSTFVAQLTLIPAMIFFAARGETGFLRSVQNVAQSLRNKPFADVQRAKWGLANEHRTRIAEQIALQGVTVFLTLVFLPNIVAPLGMGGDFTGVFIRALIASHTYFFLYSLVINLLYIADHRSALVTLIVAAVVSVVGATMLVWFDAPGWAGVSLAAAGCTGGVFAERRLSRSTADLDRTLLTRSLAG